uniref:hypothetical protein n=1 Tax=Thaumasiovibrio occultus TaxID=1891184 RepID=UPI00131A923E|nr:hypothetical protein [Thaumasiovibrio occultus]
MTQHTRRIDSQLLSQLHDDLATFAEEHDLDVIDLVVSLKLTLDDLADRAGIDLLGIRVSDPEEAHTLH